MRVAGVVIVAALAMGTAGVAHGQARTEAAELLDRLDRARAVCEAGIADPSAERMELVRGTVGLPLVVELDGWSASLPVDPHLEELDGDGEADFERALGRVEVLREALAAAVRADPLDPDLVAADLEAAYGGVVEVRPGIVERIRRAATELVQALAYRLFRFTGTSTIVAWTALIALAVGAFWLLRRLNLVPDPRALPATRGSSPVETPDWRGRAEDALRAGNLREAIRALYRSLLASLVAQGYLAERPGLTAAECRAAARQGPPALSSAVEQATASFERVVYGGRPPKPGDVSLLQRAEALARSA